MISLSIRCVYASDASREAPRIAFIISTLLIVVCQLAHKTDEYLEHLLLEVAVRSGQFFAGLVGGTHPSIHEIGELLDESLVLFGDCCS